MMIGVKNFLEFFFREFVIPVHIGMKSFYQLFVCISYVGDRGRFVKTQYDQLSYIFARKAVFPRYGGLVFRKTATETVEVFKNTHIIAQAVNARAAGADAPGRPVPGLAVPGPGLDLVAAHICKEIPAQVIFPHMGLAEPEIVVKPVAGFWRPEQAFLPAIGMIAGFYVRLLSQIKAGMESGSLVIHDAIDITQIGKFKIYLILGLEPE